MQIVTDDTFLLVLVRNELIVAHWTCMQLQERDEENKLLRGDAGAVEKECDRCAPLFQRGFVLKCDFAAFGVGADADLIHRQYLVVAVLDKRDKIDSLADIVDISCRDIP